MESIIIILILALILSQIIQINLYLYKERISKAEYINNTSINDDEEPTGDLGSEKPVNEAAHLQNFISEINKAWNGKDDE